MSAHYPVMEPATHAAPDSQWPACEQASLPQDDSLRWLGLLLMGGTSLVTLRVVVWLGQAALAHL